METGSAIRIQVELVVVGGGPAGLAAAESAARQGVGCLLIERSQQPGGQYKAVNPDPARETERDQDLLAIERLIESVATLPVQLLTGATLWRADPGVLYVCAGGQAYQVGYQALIMATGARERVTPFPGWTLPGVMTVGAAQRMLAQSDIIPGERVLVAGGGPFLIGCAAMFVEAGVVVPAVIEAAPAWRYFFKGLLALASNWRLGAKLIRDLNILRKANVRILTGSTILEAQGTDQVESADTAQLDLRGRVDISTKRSWQVDAVCVSHGLIANTRLAQALGCELAYDPNTESFFVANNDRLESSQPGVYACGEAAGIGGVRKALLEGGMAGLQAARQLRPAHGYGLDSRVDVLRRDQARLVASAGKLNALYPSHQQLAGLTGSETIVCRCEDVTASAMHAAIQEGSGTLRDLKMRTRLGMGLCQGRMCEHFAVHELTLHSQVTPDLVESLKVRPPLEPVELHIMANLPVDD